MNREFFHEWKRLTVAMKDGEKARLIDALASYAISGQDTVLCGKEAILYPVFCDIVKQSVEERTTSDGRAENVC